uniref:Kinase n=1 Tax=Solanum tuberosum TaxID=4113 RepID=M1CEW9_SOLTU
MYRKLSDLVHHVMVFFSSLSLASTTSVLFPDSVSPVLYFLCFLLSGGEMLLWIFEKIIQKIEEEEEEWYFQRRRMTLCANMPPERMLPFASQVAAIGCRALGARAGLPQLTDPRLKPFLVNDPQNVAALLSKRTQVKAIVNLGFFLIVFSLS